MKNKLIALCVLLVLLGSCRSVRAPLPTPDGARHATPLAHGAVSSPEELSAEIGAEILRRGGNAVDATVAVQFALSVTHPHAASLGGGGFMIIATPGGEVISLDYRETAPSAATVDMYQDDQGEVVREASLYGPLAAGVPGSVAGMWEAHRRYGSMPWRELIEPAIRLAEDGFALDSWTAGAIDTYQKRYAGLPDEFRNKLNFNDYWDIDAGETVRQPDLARSLQRIAEDGRDGFYKGPTAQAIVDQMQRGDGLISLEDLEGYDVVWREPVRGDYRGYEIYSMPPPSSGGIALVQLLNMFEQFEPPRWHSPEQIHLIAEIEKRVFADRSVHIGDPDFYSVPTAGLTSEAYSAQRAQSINLERRSDPATIAAGTPAVIVEEGESTTHFSVVDASGMAVSNTTTLNLWFGCGVVVEGAGFLLNDEMDDFSAKPGATNIYGMVGAEANKVEPHKRMLSSMSPTIVKDADDGSVWLVVGSPGGPTIFTTVFQVIINMIDYEMPLEMAVNAPRFHHQWPPSSLDEDEIRFEWDPGYETNQRSIDRLIAEYGYASNEPGEMGRSHLGDVQAIVIEDGRPVGVADQRRTGFVRYP